MNKIRFHLKRGLNLILTLLFTASLFTLLMFLIYRPTYKISFKGKFIGYSRDVFNIKNKIQESIFNGDDEVAYYQIDEKPEYEFTFMKAQFVPDDEKIIEEIKEEATPVYKTYAVKENDEIKARVATYSEASKILSELKKKESDNLEDITIELQYEKEEPKLVKTDKVVADLYVEKPEPVYTPIYRDYAYLSRSAGISNVRMDLPVSFTLPVGTGIISTKFLDPYYGFGIHKGIDIATYGGESIPMRAAASGTVVSCGWDGQYGNVLEIDHGGGVITLYAHASSLSVSNGETVSAGQYIGDTGSTGLSTGNHLHFEVIYNGIKLNPEYYINFPFPYQPFL